MSDPICLEAAQYARAPSMAHLFLFKIGTCILASSCAFLLLVLKRWKWLVHPNAKLLFISHILYCLLLPAGYSVVYIWDYIRITSDFANPCDYLVSGTWAMYSRYVPVVGLIGEMLSMLCLAVERAISTCYKSTYEAKNNALLSVTMCIIVLLASIYIPYCLLIEGEDLDRKMTTYTMLTQTNHLKFQLIVFLETAIELMTIVLFSVVYVFNKNHKRAESLATNYQVAENVKVTGRLLPVYVIHAVFFLLNSFGLSLFTMLIPSVNVNTHKMLLESVGQVHLYSIIMPAFILIRSFYQKKHTAPLSGDAAKELYFQKLAKQWE